MTRAADAALSTMQLELGERCERLLASDDWNRAPTATKSGLLERLQMITDSGLPPMRLVPNSTLERLGRIPRSHERHQVDAAEAVQRCGAETLNRPNAVILFYSHRWLRPNWSEALGKHLEWSSAERQEAMKNGVTFGDPDDADHSKAKALIEYGKWFKRVARASKLESGATISNDANLEIFWWIDWACTDQDNPGPDMAALPAYAAACAAIAAAWNAEYASRAWCQVELLMAYAFVTTGKMVFVVPSGFANASTRRLEFAPDEEVTVANPAKGQLTNDKDRAVIQSLTDVATRSTAFSCWRVFIKRSTDSVVISLGLNVCCCCQWCGLLAWGASRTVRPGESSVTKKVPLDYATTHAAPSDAVMEREAQAAAKTIMV